MERQEETFVCRICRERKTARGYRDRKNLRPGRCISERICNYCVHKRWLANGGKPSPRDPKEVQAVQLKWARTPRGWASHAIHRLKRRAAEKGVPFTITVEDIVAAFPKDGICPALKVPFIYGTKIPGPASPSVDKLRPELGYTKENIRIISHKANRIKQNATPEKLRAVAKWLRETLATHAGAI